MDLATSYIEALLIRSTHKCRINLGCTGHTNNFLSVIRQQKKRGSSEEGLWSKSDLLADTMSRMIHSCTFCSAPTVPLKRCPTCRLARYCSEECRDRYAAHHSLVCARSKADVVAKFLEVSPIDVEELHSGLRKDKGRRVREMAEARNDHVNTLFRCIFDVKNAVLTATADENKDE